MSTVKAEIQDYLNSTPGGLQNEAVRDQIKTRALASIADSLEKLVELTKEQLT